MSNGSKLSAHGIFGSDVYEKAADFPMLTIDKVKNAKVTLHNGIQTKIGEVSGRDSLIDIQSNLVDIDTVKEEAKVKTYHEGTITIKNLNNATVTANCTRIRANSQDTGYLNIQNIDNNSTVDVSGSSYKYDDPCMFACFGDVKNSTIKQGMDTKVEIGGISSSEVTVGDSGKLAQVSDMEINKNMTDSTMVLKTRLSRVKIKGNVDNSDITLEKETELSIDGMVKNSTIKSEDYTKLTIGTLEEGSKIHLPNKSNTLALSIKKKKKGSQIIAPELPEGDKVAKKRPWWKLLG